MNEAVFTPDLAAEDVAVALVSLGWPIEPYGLDLAFWRIWDLVLTNDELMGFAARQGIRSVSERMH